MRYRQRNLILGFFVFLLMACFGGKTSAVSDTVSVPSAVSASVSSGVSLASYSSPVSESISSVSPSASPSVLSDAVTTYTVSFYNGSSFLVSVKVNEGEIPVYPGAEPTFPETEYYTYDFSGWLPELTPAYSDYSVYADFKAVPKPMTAYFYNYDHTLWATSTVPYLTRPTYPETPPTRPSTESSDYTFNSWRDASGKDYFPGDSLPVIRQDKESYTAVFSEAVHFYQVTFLDGDGINVLFQEQVVYGKTAHYGGKTPTKAETDETYFVFTGWQEDLTAPITANTVFHSVFSEHEKGIGMLFELLSDDTYAVSGTTTDLPSEAYVPNTHSGKAVTAIGSQAFRSETGLTGIRLGTSIQSIGTYALAGATSLAEIVLPDSLTAIEAWAFQGDSSLTTVTISPTSSLSQIADGAFENCTALTSFYLPPLLTSFSRSIVSGCTALASLSVSDSNTAFAASSGLLYTKTYESCLFCPPAVASAVSLHSLAKTVVSYAFSSTLTLTSLTINKGLSTIQESAFSGSHLQQVLFESGSVLTSLPKNCFLNCASLTDITLPKALSSVDKEAFIGCTGLKAFKVESGNSAYAIQQGLLISATSKTAYLLPQGYQGSLTFTLGTIDHVGTRFAYGCQGLTGISLDRYISDIDSLAFAYCTGLTGDVLLGPDVFHVQSQAFLGCSNVPHFFVQATTLPTGFATDWCPYPAKVYLYSETSREGNYFHFDENQKPILWNP